MINFLYIYFVVIVSFGCFLATKLEIKRKDIKIRGFTFLSLAILIWPITFLILFFLYIGVIDYLLFKLELKKILEKYAFDIHEYNSILKNRKHIIINENEKYDFSIEDNLRNSIEKGWISYIKQCIITNRSSNIKVSLSLITSLNDKIHFSIRSDKDGKIEIDLKLE